jgi:hypothetical protein
LDKKTTFNLTSIKFSAAESTIKLLKVSDVKAFAYTSWKNYDTWVIVEET